MELSMVKNASHPAFSKALISLILLKLILFCFVNSIQLRVALYMYTILADRAFIFKFQTGKIKHAFPLFICLMREFIHRLIGNNVCRFF